MPPRYAAAVLAAVFCCTFAPARAQTSTASVPSTEERYQRMFGQFITDPATTSQWWEIGMRGEFGSVGPIQNADGWAIGPTIAISPMKELELGGRVDYIDYTLDNEINGPGGTDFDGASGAGDIELWGKYRFPTEVVQVAAGAILTLPTGSENDGLGSGKVIPAIFGAVRHNFGQFSGVAHLGVRFNPDFDPFGDDIPPDSVNGKSSVFLGAGAVVPAMDRLFWTAEITVESERFDAGNGFDTDSDIRAIVGANWSPVGNHNIRASVEAGLSDQAPDFVLTGSYVYRF